MKISANHLKRYREIIRLLWKYGRSDLVEQLRRNEGFEMELEDPPTAESPALPEQLADDLEAMGPRNDMEAALLRELHPIDVRDGGMWAAIRMRPREPYELWYREEVDVRLQGSFSDYLDLLFKARGRI